MNECCVSSENILWMRAIVTRKNQVLEVIRIPVMGKFSMHIIH